MSKLEELYSISSQIMSKYIELIHTPRNTVSRETYQELIEELKYLVHEEYQISHSMSQIEVKLCLEKLANQSQLEYDTSVLSRITNKLIDSKEVLSGNYITSEELDIPNLPADIKISTYDVILSAIDIETTKIVRSKIYNLVTSSKEEMNFVRSLKAKLEESKTSLIFAGSAFEVLALYSDMDINKIPNVALKTIKPKQISQMTLQNTMNNALAIYTKKTLDALVATTYYNNPKDIFNYLTLITRMDVLISYMDQKMIDAVYTYCDNNNPNNNKNIENVKRLIREKNKRKTEE